jgi:hypothetical protein
METYAALADQLGMSASEVHAAVRRLQEARLADPESRKIRLQAFHSFLLFGVPYAFPGRLGEPCRGMPTAWAAPVLSKTAPVGHPMPPVWPDSKGTAVGLTVRPLYPSVPHAARADSKLYDWLAMVDALRLGEPVQRASAQAEMDRRLAGYRS